MTPVQQAAYALDFGVSREDLKPAVRAEYDRQLAERRAQPSRQAVPEAPEVRAKMLKQANREYAKALEAERDRLALMQGSAWRFLLPWLGSLVGVLVSAAVVQWLWPGRLDLSALAGGAVGATVAGLVTGPWWRAGRR